MENGEVRPHLPDGLLAALRADPVRAPEHLALAAADRHGPAAAEWVAEQGGRDPRKLAQAAKRSHARLARFGGAATGVGGFYTVLPDLALMLWIQSRMVFYIAAAYGYEPRDRMRPAELLVLRDLYPTPRAAREALDGIGTPVAMAYVASRRERDQALAGRLLALVGRHGARRIAGRLVPLVAVGVNAVADERDTRRLADRAIAFYER